MKCPNCKKEISNTATFCKLCGFKISDNTNPLYKNLKGVSSKKQYKKYVIIGVVTFLAIIYLLGFKCRAGICILPSGFKDDYCVLHTCDRSSCYNKVAKGKKYCYTHLPSTSTNSRYTPEKAEDVLEFSDITINRNSSYTVCDATITNNGRKTYSFVEVKGKFKDSSGTILDTDWTYAVGSEGLAPGESATFRLSVKKNLNISKCEFEIIDYNKE